MDDIKEGPTVAESHRDKEFRDIVFTHRIRAVPIDVSPIIRIYEPPTHTDSFLNYLEFRMNQKPTLWERIFGKGL